mmetsp:Transcript_19652/g.41231  ORF Transcript_19652/g.41231 Transcript_19652/m.41231 type:complete len:116 (+) Transcript_19652:826-1173(+)
MCFSSSFFTSEFINSRRTFSQSIPESTSPPDTPGPCIRLPTLIGAVELISKEWRPHIEPARYDDPQSKTTNVNFTTNMMILESIETLPPPRLSKGWDILVRVDRRGKDMVDGQRA